MSGPSQGLGQQFPHRLFSLSWATLVYTVILYEVVSLVKWLQGESCPNHEIAPHDPGEGHNGANGHLGSKNGVLRVDLRALFFENRARIPFPSQIHYFISPGGAFTKWFIASTRLITS